MHDLDEILASSSNRLAFANGHSWDRWSFRWCDQCRHDINESCPLVTAAMAFEVTPMEWKEVALDEYECSEFEPREEYQ